MARAKLTLTIPEGVWIGDASRSHPEATLRVLAALPSEDAGVGLAEVSGPDVESVLADLADPDSVSEFEVLQRYEDDALVQFETSMPLLLLPVQGSGVPLEMPFEIRDGRAEWEVTAPQRRLSELATQLEEFGISYTVEELKQRVEPEQLLTDRQERLIETAVEVGYYDTPRESSLTELAEEVGIAKSTCSETLHRAEEKIVKQFVGDLSETTLRAQTS